MNYILRLSRLPVAKDDADNLSRFFPPDPNLLSLYSEDGSIFTNFFTVSMSSFHTAWCSLEKVLSLETPLSPGTAILYFV